MNPANPMVQRAQLLLNQSRFDLAERELRGSLAEDPEDYASHALLAYALLRLGRHAEAIAEAGQAIGRAPDAPYAHWVMSLALYGAGRRAEARAAAERALELDPGDPDHHSLLGWMDLEDKRWAGALAHAEAGLALDAEHVQSANVRAQALVKLGRGGEAGATLGTTLAREPESALTHANMGWTLLEGGDHRKALEHFREALRLDPTSEWAREGIVEAMKARNPAYRVMLKWFFLMGKLRGRAQWLLLLGAVFGVRFLNGIGAANPGFKPFAAAISAAYLAFAFATWLSRPLFDLLLRLDRFGRLCLSPDQLRASNWLGATLALSAGFGLAGWFLGRDTLFTAALGTLLLCLPVAGVFQVRDPRRRRVHAAYAIGLALCGLLALALPGPQDKLGTLFFLGVIAYSWFGNLYK